MSDAPRINRRRNVLSLPGAQLRIIGLFTVMALLYAAVNAYVSRSALQRLATDALAIQAPPQVHRDLERTIIQHGDTLDLQLVLFTFLSFTMLVLAGVLISHRIGGPVYHLKAYMDGQVKATVPPRRIQFRKDDFFHDLAAGFNTFQEKVGLVPRQPVDPSTAKKPDASASGPVAY